MSKRKIEVLSVNYSCDSTSINDTPPLKKQKKEEDLLHKLLLHPDINQFALNALPSNNVFSVMQTNQQLFTSIPNVLKTLRIPSKGLQSNKQVFSNVNKLEIYGSCSDSLLINVEHFPYLKSVSLQNVIVKEIIITSPIVKLSFTNSNKDSLIPILAPQTIREVYFCGNTAATLTAFLHSQPNIECAEIDIKDSQLRTVSVTFNQVQLKKLKFAGNPWDKCTIHSLENMEELEYNGRMFITNRSSTSSLRVLRTSKNAIAFEAAIGDTKFPYLNFFSFKSTSQSSVAQRIYKECVERDQKEISPFSMTFKQKCYVSVGFLYCNNITSITNLHVRCLTDKSSQVFIENVPSLQHLSTTNQKDNWHILPFPHSLTTPCVMVSKTFTRRRENRTIKLRR